MNFSKNLLPLLLVFFVLCLCANSQQIVQPAPTVVPQLINFPGRAADNSGKPITGTVGMTFAIYKDQAGSSPLWMETQNVQPDVKGNYNVQLGANSSQGIPLELFASGEARWLGVRINGGEEQPRVLLLSVPYALKAADAQTVGGLPASAFVLAAAGGSTGSSNSSTSSPPSSPNVGGSGTQNYIPLWTDNSGDLGNSVLYQLGTGPSAKLGINLTNPLLTLDVNGSELVRGLFEMATTGFATPTKAFNSQPLNIESSAFNSSTQKYTLNHFQWQAEATGNNTGMPGATLNLLYGTDPATPTETGLRINSKGIFTFAPGQTFPGGGGGTVTSVGLSAPSSDFTVTGSPITTSGTLGLNWAVAPTSADTANAIVKRDANGNFSTRAISTSTSEYLAKNFEATADSGYAFYGTNNSDEASTLWLTNLDDGYGGMAEFEGYDEFGNPGYCLIYSAGVLSCSGGTSTAVPVDNSTRKVALYPVEAPENWFEDYGTARLSNGQAMIRLDPTFAQTVNTDMNYHVFVTPRGECEGLYVTDSDAAGFSVRELHRGRSNIAFDYRIVARRKGYENVRLADLTKHFNRQRPQVSPPKAIKPPSSERIHKHAALMPLASTTALETEEPNSRKP